jgi:hypothetical protein
VISENEVEQAGEAGVEVLTAQGEVELAPGRCWRITPLSRRARQWWVRLDFGPSGRIAPQNVSSPDARACTIARRTGCPMAARTSTCPDGESGGNIGL